MRPNLARSTGRRSFVEDGELSTAYCYERCRFAYHSMHGRRLMADEAKNFANGYARRLEHLGYEVEFL